MMRMLAALSMFCLLAGPASATGSISCEAGAEDGVMVELVIGSVPVLAVVGATISVGNESWTLVGEGEHQISVGQAFGDDNRMLVDFTDTNFERIVAQLRLFVASEGKDLATGGTLSVEERGAWTVNCFGP